MRAAWRLLPLLAAARALFHSVCSGPHPAGKAALDEALTLLALTRGAEAPAPDLCCVCVGLPLENSFEAIIDEAAERTRARLLIGVLGAGVLGAGQERELAPCVSVAAGALPPESECAPFVLAGADVEDPFARGRENYRLLSREGTSCLLFGDPYSPIDAATTLVGSWVPGAVVGGISCPSAPDRPSVALRQTGTRIAVPAGSVAGVAFRGPRLEMHALTAQGAAGVGPTARVTAAPARNIVGELDGAPAIESLRSVLSKAIERDNRVAELLKSSLLVGLRPKSELEDEPFLIRQVRGATSDGMLLVGDQNITEDTELRFHVRDDVAAREDLAAILQRYSLEKMFRGKAGTPLLSFLVTCAGRGENLFGEPGVDSEAFGGLSAPVVGFFANGEIGPIGARVPGDTSIPSFLHGFTATAAVLVDTGEPDPGPES